MEKEIELKYDVNSTFNIGTLINYLNQNNIEILKEKEVSRVFTYFDTPDNYFLRNGFTLRCIGGFNPKTGDGKGNFRYDVKIGSTHNHTRKELSIWSDEQKHPKNLFGEIDEMNFDTIEISAITQDTTHKKINIQYKKSTIEISLDTFQIENQKGFMELELELKDGEIEDLIEFGKNLQRKFGIIPINIQKYQRVLEIKYSIKSKIEGVLVQEHINLAFMNYEQNVRNIIEDIPENKNFINNPDDVFEHHLGWHQFGILTHSKNVFQNYKNYENYIHSDQIKDFVRSYLSEEIEGFSKKILLAISLIYHDVGKFKRTFENGKVDYTDHESKSRQLLLPQNEREDFKEEIDLYNDVKRIFGLNDTHMRYIANCAGLHYELGNTRSFLKNNGGYNIKTISSGILDKEFEQLIVSNPDYSVEIGVLFLSDAIGKTDILLNLTSDQEIELFEETIKNILQERSLPQELGKAIKQFPVNIALVNEYLKKVKTLFNLDIEITSENGDKSYSINGVQYQLIEFTQEEIGKSQISKQNQSAGLLWIDQKDKIIKFYGIPKKFLKYSIINEVLCPNVLGKEGGCLNALKVELKNIPPEIINEYISWRIEFFKNIERFYLEDLSSQTKYDQENKQYGGEMKKCVDYLTTLN